ncbi:hypothetical protein ARMGADRAFT_1014910 [Armillaria gallica]|uniref:Uncharacterized protein n=1 Tax=Armillaria gallica TaxID=47427 RepID=A0A2H3D6M1_ARMGA|nr:hypothetical protein ARMGADRAFT_1014910 [Armillaria gallica]
MDGHFFGPFRFDSLPLTAKCFPRKSSIITSHLSFWERYISVDLGSRDPINEDIVDFTDG